MKEELKYYINIGGSTSGPFSIEELRLRSITPDTKVWYEGIPDWVRADTVAAIREDVLGCHYPPPPPGHYNSGPEHLQQNPMPRFCPSTYMVPSVLLAICCCNPLAIVAIVYAMQVEPAYSRGYYDQAANASNRARSWCIIATVAWLAITLSIGFLSLGAFKPFSCPLTLFL